MAEFIDRFGLFEVLIMSVKPEVRKMRLIIFSAALAMALLFGFVKVAIQPKALVQDWQPSSADLTHPPSAFGTSAIVSSPHEPRR